MSINEHNEVSESFEIAWKPTTEYDENSRLRHFMRQFDIPHFGELMRRSTEDIEWFWDATVEFMKLEWYKPYSKVVDLGAGPGWSKPRWFVDGKFNYVHNALDKYAFSSNPAIRDKTALIAEGEDGEVRRYTYAELYAETNRLANALTELGIGKGDRVGVFLPMIPEVVMAVLAVSKVGAVYTPIFSGYAANAVSTRLNDCEAKLLITADGFYRRGGVVNMKAVADEAAEQVPSLQHLLVVKRIGQEVNWQNERDIWWNDIVPRQSDNFDTVETDAEDPYMIIYTSGTTGRPKGAVHTHCGFPIKGAQDMQHCFDVNSNDTLFWFTDIGWMMGPWAIGGTLMLGGTVCIYEGSPDYPNPGRIWEMVEKHKITVLGIAPTAIRALMGQGDEWVTKHDLSSLRILGSSGEPWNPGPWQWFFEKIGGGRCPIINYSGGTEISGGILACNPLLPIKPTSFSAAVPGMAADVVDEAGNPVRGAVGELVIRKPWPGMTRGFWKDNNDERYQDAYWSRIPGLWVHGDWARIDDDGFWYILGRSDDTIKVAGKRVGPAEIESAAVSHPAVLEAAAIGVPHEVKGDVVVCFVVLRPNNEPSEELREAIKSAITAQMGKALKPDSVKFVKMLPKTRSAKVMRRVIRAKYLNRELGDLSSIDNMAAIDEIGQAQ